MQIDPCNNISACGGNEGPVRQNQTAHGKTIIGQNEPVPVSSEYESVIRRAIQLSDELDKVSAGELNIDMDRLDSAESIRTAAENILRFGI